MTPKPTGHPVVDAVDALSLTGNVIPHAWYHTIVNSEGKPEHVAILLLGEIVFWHRSRSSRDPKTGQWVREKRFKADALQLNRGMLEQKFNVSPRHISRCLKFLEDLGVIKRERRNVVVQGRTLNNVLYIVLIPEILKELSPDPNQMTPSATPAAQDASGSGHPGQQVGTNLSAGADDSDSGCGDPGRTNTQSTPKIKPERDTRTTTTAPGGADRREAPVAVVAGDLNVNSNAFPEEGDCFLKFYRKVFPIRFQRPATISQDDLAATADFFQDADWGVLSVATVMILAWEKIGQRDPENGYRYPCCQHSKSLKKFFQHFERIVSDVQGENIPDADVIKLFSRILKWYPDLGKDWLIDLFSPFVCGEDEDGDGEGGQ